MTQHHEAATDRAIAAGCHRDRLRSRRIEPFADGACGRRRRKGRSISITTSIRRFWPMRQREQPRRRHRRRD